MSRPTPVRRLLPLWYIFIQCVHIGIYFICARQAILRSITYWCRHYHWELFKCHWNIGNNNIRLTTDLGHFKWQSIVWHFCGVGNTKKMEKIQERGLRFVYGDYTSDYDSLLCKSKMPSLKLGRERNIAIQTYKIKNNLAPRYLKELITPIQNSKFHLSLFKSTRHGLNSFAYMAPRIWNTLPECTHNATSLQKSRINKWSGIHRSQHKCANCIKSHSSFIIIIFFLSCYFKLCLGS